MDERSVIFCEGFGLALEAPLPAHACCFPQKLPASFTASRKLGMEIHTFGLVQLFLFALWGKSIVLLVSGLLQASICESIIVNALALYCIDLIYFKDSREISL